MSTRFSLQRLSGPLHSLRAPADLYVLERKSHFDDVARLLAGMDLPEESPLYAHRQKQRCGRSTITLWTEPSRALGQSTIEPMKLWAAAEIPQAPPVVFYPFGGPDMAIPLALFGNTKEFVLFGMEPTGIPPDMSMLQPDLMPEAYGVIRSALSWYLAYTYFQTYQMDRWLRRPHLGGAGPVILVFLARSGARIIDMKPVEPAEGSGAPGIRIDFEYGGQRRVVTYFQADASNEGLARRPAFLQYIRSRGERATFLKAAACLPHYEKFSVIRSFIARESSLVLTDDAGMPYADLVRERMSIKHYGRYVDTMPLFRACLQPDLVAAFKAGARALPFEIGYNASVMRGRSSLVLATRIP
jgi:hypothetical protein